MLNTVLLAIGGVVVASLIIYMVLYEQFNVQVRNLHLCFPNLPPAFDGYTILHLSDLHLTKLGKLERRVMDIIGSREVDTCFITGDVTAKPRASDIFRRVCSAIRHRDPIYMVLGNSEHKPWLDTSMLVDALKFDGLEMLINSSAIISRGDDHVRVVGIDDAYSRLDDVEAAFEEVRGDEFVIFLTHSPCAAPRGIEKGADLILAGHTHGGQVRLPFLGVVFTHTRSHKALNDGLYMSDRLAKLLKTDPGHSVLFVSRGIGTSRLHIRLLCPPEIVYITLHRG